MVRSPDFPIQALPDVTRSGPRAQRTSIRVTLTHPHRTPGQSALGSFPDLKWGFS